MGVCAAYLMANGIKVVDSQELPRANK